VEGANRFLVTLVRIMRMEILGANLLCFLMELREAFVWMEGTTIAFSSDLTEDLGTTVAAIVSSRLNVPMHLNRTALSLLSAAAKLRGLARGKLTDSWSTFFCEATGTSTRQAFI